MKQDGERFDRLAQTLAGTMNRRRSMRVFGSALFAATAAALVPKRSKASPVILPGPVGSACQHHMCCEGEILVSGCDSNCCIEYICLTDAYCCRVEWDALCVQEVATLCYQDCSAIVCEDPAPSSARRR